MEDASNGCLEKLIVRIPRSKLSGLENFWDKKKKKKKKVKRERQRKKETRAVEDVLSSQLGQLEDKKGTNSGEKTMNEVERHAEETQITHFKKRIIRNHSVTSDVYCTSPNISEDDRSWQYKTQQRLPGELSCNQTIQQEGPSQQAHRHEESPSSKQDIPLRYIEQNSKEPINYSTTNLSTQIESSIENTMKEKDAKSQVGKHQLPTVVMPTNTRTTVRPTMSRRLSLGEPLLNRISPTEPTQNQPLSAPIITQREHVQPLLVQRPETSLVVDIQVPKTPIQRNQTRGPTIQNFQNQFAGYPYPNMNHRSRYPLPVVPQPNFMDYYRGNINHMEKRTVENNMEQLNHLHHQLMENSRNQLRHSHERYPPFNPRAPPAYTDVSHRPEPTNQQQYPQNPFMAHANQNFDRRRIPHTVVSPQASMLPPNISPSIPQAQDRHDHDIPDEKIEDTKLNIYEAMERECAKVLNNFYQVMDTIRDSERSRKNNSSSRAYFFLAMNKISSKIGEIESFLSKCNEFAEKSKSNHDEHHIFYSLLDCMKDFTARIRSMVGKARNTTDRKKNAPLITAVEESFYKNVFYRMFDYITSNTSPKNDDKDSNKPQETSPTSDDNLSTINCIIFKQQESNSRNMIVMPLVGQCPNRCCSSSCPNHQSLENDHPEEEKTESQSNIAVKPKEDQPEKPKVTHETPKSTEDPVLERIEKELELMEKGKKQNDGETKDDEPVDDKAETLREIRDIEAKQKPKYKISEILCIEIDSECDSADEKVEIKKEPPEEDSILKRKLEESENFEIAKKVKLEVGCEKVTQTLNDEVIIIDDNDNLDGSVEINEKPIQENLWKTPPTFKMQFPNTVISKNPDIPTGNEEILVVDKGNVRHNQQRRNSLYSERTPSWNMHSNKAPDIARDLKKSFSTPPDLTYPNTTPRITNITTNNHVPTPGVLNLSNTVKENPNALVRNHEEISHQNHQSTAHKSPILINKLLNVTENRTTMSPMATQEGVTSPRIPVFPKLGSIYDETVKTDGFVSQIIKEQISCLSKKEALEPLEYVKEVETLQKIRTLPDEFKEFYVYITKVQILHKHNPIAFRLFLELLNQGGLIDYHKKFSEYVTRKRIINKSISNMNKGKSRRSSIKNK